MNSYECWKVDSKSGVRTHCNTIFIAEGLELMRYCPQCGDLINENAQEPEDIKDGVGTEEERLQLLRNEAAMDDGIKGNEEVTSSTEPDTTELQVVEDETTHLDDAEEEAAEDKTLYDGVNPQVTEEDEGNVPVTEASAEEVTGDEEVTAAQEGDLPGIVETYGDTHV